MTNQTRMLIAAAAMFGLYIGQNIVKKPIKYSEGEAMSFCKDDEIENKAYGCLFCRVGCENHAINEILRDDPCIKLIFPTKMRFNRRKKENERVPLFPGYIFIHVANDYKITTLIQNRYVYRVLTYGGFNWQLVGTDREIAEKLFGCNGVIDFSKAYYENDRICIIEGFLKEYEGSIIKVDHRMRTALVKIDFFNISLKVWLGFELLDYKTEID